MDPINYQQDVQTPFAAAAQGYQLGAAMRNDQQQQEDRVRAMQAAQAAQQRQALLQQELTAASTDHTKLPGLMVRYPELAEKLKFGLEAGNKAAQERALSEATPVYSALMSGRPDVAVASARTHAEALRNSGKADEADAVLRMADRIEADPQGTATFLAGHLSSIPGGDKVIEGVAKQGAEQRLRDKAPAELREANAKAGGAESDEKVKANTVAQLPVANATQASQASEAASKAVTAKVTADNAAENARLDLQNKGLQGQNLRSEIADRAKRFGLDTDKFQSELKLKLLELQNKLGELPEPVAKEVNTATTDAIAAQNSAAKMTDLAQQIEKASGELSGGAAAKAGELWKKTFGTQNDLTRIRAEYSRIVTPAAMGAYKQVASGSTSDKDIETAMLGVPKDTDSPERMASFLRGAAKLQAYEAVLKNAQAEWQGAVRSLGKAKTDISIDGVNVPAGTTFKQFADQYVQDKAAKLQAVTTVQSRGYMKFAAPATAAPAGLGSGTFGVPQ